MKTYFKLYGIQRTGTNYLKWLIEKNFEEVVVLQNILGHKHFTPAKQIDWSGATWQSSCNPKPTVEQMNDILEAHENNKLMFLITTRNPFSWIIGMKNFRRATLTDDFIRKHVRMWNGSVHKQLIFASGREECTIFLFEHLIASIGALTFLQRRFNLKKKNEKWNTSDKIIKIGDESPATETETMFNAEYYLKSQYLDEYTEDQIELIKTEVDPRILATLHYGTPQKEQESGNTDTNN